MLLKASTRRRSSSDERTAMRASKSPRAMRRVARVSRRTGSAMRSAIDRPIAAPSRMKNSAARWTPRSRSSISRSISLLAERQRHGQDRVAVAGRAPARRRSCTGHVADLVLVDEAGQPIAGRWRDRRRRACASAGSPTRTGRARSSRAAAAPSKMLTSWSINWLIQTITSSLPGAISSLLRRQQRVGFLDDALRHGGRARRFRLDVVAQQVREVGRG